LSLQESLIKFVLQQQVNYAQLWLSSPIRRW
jgi:hypothetical protein